MAFLTLFAVSSLSVALAAPSDPYPGAPADFNPYRAYPKPAVFPYHNYTGQGAHWDAAQQAAWKAANQISGRDQPSYGPGSYVTSSAGLKWYDPTFTDGTKGVSAGTYTCFGGTVSSFPAISQWMNFYDMFQRNQKSNYGMAGTPDSGEQTGEIYNAIVSVSKASKVDARLILAVIMQESTGNVYVPCTAGYNCGLMQANHGSVSYNAGSSISDSQNSINQMVTDGTEGTTQGPGYAQYMGSVGSYGYTHCQIGNPYAAARAYNTGSCSTGGNLNCAQYGTASYVNDIANRLLGWDGSGSNGSKCGFPAVGCTGK